MTSERENTLIIKKENFDFQKLYNLGGYLAGRSNFCEEPTLIITACEEKSLEILETILSAGAAAGGGHVVRLSLRNEGEFIKGFEFFDADYGVYISGTDEFVCRCKKRGTGKIHNFESDFNRYCAPREFKAGKISHGLIAPWECKS